MKETIEKVTDSGRFVWAIVLGIPFIIGLLGCDEIVYIGYIAILTIIFQVMLFIEEKSFGSFILSVISTPFTGFAIWALLLIPAGIGQLIGGPWSVNQALIKGNISYYTHEKIYHVPGCKHYEDTVINTSDGEKWFKTEEEARKAGWRKCRTDDKYY